MQISKKDNEKSYQKHTQQDSKVLSDFIVNKINFLPKHLSKKQVYNPYFWENDTRVLIVGNSPSSRLNQHYTDANEYVEKHYNTIVEKIFHFLLTKMWKMRFIMMMKHLKRMTFRHI